MEKKTPHYNLQCIQGDVRRLGAVAFTKSALDGGRTLGLTLAQNVAGDSRFRTPDAVQIDVNLRRP